jgi:hypothetical protein
MICESSTLDKLNLEKLRLHSVTSTSSPVIIGEITAFS